MSLKLNKMKIKIISLGFLAVIIYGCTEKFELNIENNTNSVVIEGVVTNDNDSYYNYIRITKGNIDLVTKVGEVGFDDGAEIITNALVIISDNVGNVDTFFCDLKYPTGSRYGYYVNDSFKGVSGRTYNLNVKIGNETYTAEAFMPPVVDIDSIETVDDYLPVIYFNDPINEKNYYLFNLHTVTGPWCISVIDDKFLSPDISTNGFTVDDGENPRWWVSNYQWISDDIKMYMKVSMSSLTKESYDYYRSIITQFNNDGGVYSPSPASPKGNISNGAIGYFRASSISVITDEN